MLLDFKDITRSDQVTIPYILPPIGFLRIAGSIHFCLL